MTGGRRRMTGVGLWSCAFDKGTFHLSGTPIRMRYRLLALASSSALTRRWSCMACLRRRLA